MGSRSILDVESLLQPISAENPTGEELTSVSPEFDSLKSAFSAAKVAERKMREELIAAGSEGLANIDAPEWSDVTRQAETLLRERSKDLRVAAWLIEGLMRQHGFAGVRDGLALFEELCLRYWPTIHPAPTAEDGHRDTVAQFGGLIGESSLIPLNEIPITASASGEAYSSIDYAEASELDSIADPELRDKRLANGAITFSQMENAVRQTNRQFYVDLVEDLRQVLERLERIDNFLYEHCARDDYGESTAPGSGTFRGRVQEILDSVKALAASHLAEPDVGEDGVTGVNGELITAGGGEGRVRMSTGIVVSRDDALEVLRKVASYFEHAEPHSPISFALRQIVNWGAMSLPELLRELIEDDSVMKNLEKRIGLPRNQEGY